MLIIEMQRARKGQFQALQRDICQGSASSKVGSGLYRCCEIEDKLACSPPLAGTVLLRLSKADPRLKAKIHSLGGAGQTQSL